MAVSTHHISSFDMVASPGFSSAIVKSSPSGMTITGRTKEEAIRLIKDSYGKVFPIEINLACGCSAKYEASIEFPAGTVKCIHGNAIVEYKNV